MRAIPRHAITALHAELVLEPKPGLVCPGDRGSHDDMDAATMMRSIVSLRHGFVRLVDASARAAPFARLQAIGLDAEAAMLRATGNVNTHRGAFFTLGLLAAAAARLVVDGAPITPATLRPEIRKRWGRELLRSVTMVEAHPAPATHGREMATRHGAGGARREAADGFPTLFESVIPALLAARARGADERGARLHALVSAIAVLEDTNLLHRGGVAGLRHAQEGAREFLAADGVLRPDRDARLEQLGRSFVASRLSPGGSADLLAAALFVERLAAGETPA